jgi:hypothetical protein
MKNSLLERQRQIINVPPDFVQVFPFEVATTTITSVIGVQEPLSSILPFLLVDDTPFLSSISANLRVTRIGRLTPIEEGMDPFTGQVEGDGSSHDAYKQSHIPGRMTANQMI